MTESTYQPPDDWPPPGMTSWYKVEERFDGQPVRTYDMTLPSTFSKVNLATVRIGRHGGPNDDDRQFRRELYEKLGAIVVAGGHVETAMKRLILLLEAPPEADFSLVDDTWTALDRRLRRLADGTTEQRTELRAVLVWGEVNNMKGRRDDVVHAYWWTFAETGVRRSRFNRKSEGKTILGEFDRLSEDADLLFMYAEKLDALLGADWVIARLPATE